MARRYSRDNRGRFAPTGSGATARGGRLRTAAGNKRATVTTKSGMVAQGRMTGAPLKGTIGKTDKSRLNINLTRPSKPGQRGAYNEARMQIRANKAAPKPTATTTKLGGRLNPAKKAFRAADKKFLSTIQKEKGISKAASDARRDAKSSSDFTKTPTTKGPKINNTISQTKEKRDIETKQRLFKQRITRAYNLSGNGTDAKGRRTAKVKAKAIATLQGTKRPDVSDSTVGGLRRARTSTGYRAPSSRLPTPSRAARAQSRAQTLAKTQRFDAVGRRLGNPTKMDNKARTGARAVDFNSNPKAFLRRTLVQKVQSRGGKGTAGFVAKPRSLTQAPKRIKKATTAKPKPAAAAPKPAATAKSRAAKPAAAAARTAAPKPAAAPKPKRRVFIRGNFRPRNIMANPAPDKTKYYNNQKGKNIAELEAIVKKAGANTQVVTKRKQKLAIAMAIKPMNLVRLNKASDFYANPRQISRAQRRMGHLSTTDPRGVAFHELGHLRQKKKSENIFTQREFSSPRNARLAGRVSQYAKTNANEFAAETYAGLKTGRRYDSQVMRAYREEMGLRPLSIRRQLKRSATKRKP